jgi:hypothetical protein
VFLGEAGDEDVVITLREAVHEIAEEKREVVLRAPWLEDAAQRATLQVHRSQQRHLVARDRGGEQQTIATLPEHAANVLVREVHRHGDVAGREVLDRDAVAALIRRDHGDLRAIRRDHDALDRLLVEEDVHRQQLTGPHLNLRQRNAFVAETDGGENDGQGGGKQPPAGGQAADLGERKPHGKTVR